MNKSTSLYLDLLRVVAAFGVLLVHANLSFFSNNLYFREEYGHKLVMVFFVLSGYLIAFTVDKKNKGATKYLVDRTSRLYSVVLPALLLTFILDTLGKHFNAAAYAGQVAPGNQLLRYLLNATFLSQIWKLSTKPSSNGPFWSISYEFWYYMLFAVYIYLQGAKRYIAAALICFLIGIKILLLLPVWVFGCLAYRASSKYTLSKGMAATIFTLTLTAVVVLTCFWDFSVFADRLVFGKPPFYFSSRFVFDWVYGALVAINLFSVSYLADGFRLPGFLEKAVKHLSSVTFSLYLYHAPILIFISAVAVYDKSSYLQTGGILIGVILLVNVLAVVSEKQRGHFKTFFEKLFNSFTRLSANAK
ncbi:acyltransferase [Mucilaginibacter sp. PPCGB 2223]|uniref:acyltransferase family protein n=1 Tax=Mucilaginibacter sp. PPCGB 2223 TaxID=1886027 RepID=UPI001112689E|nr:acyltransferase [Mucilaginibacter sp. PPCGB 2223]